MPKTRVKWFSLPIDRGKLRALADAMRGSTYSAKRGHGFALTDVRTTSITGCLIERTEREITEIDPFGTEIKQTITVFVRSMFTITTAEPGLEVINAPRSIRLLLGQITALSQFSVTITEIQADPLQWLTCLEKDKLRVQVKELEYTDIAFRGGATGTLSLRGKNDIREAGQKIVGERPKQVHRLEASIENVTLPPTEITLERNGRAQIPSAALDDLRRDLCAALLISRTGS